MLPDLSDKTIFRSAVESDIHPQILIKAPAGRSRIKTLSMLDHYINNKYIFCSYWLTYVFS